MRAISVAAALWITAAFAHAQDAQLVALHGTLMALHSHAAEANFETRGARPELTVAKHQLRDWIETQLQSIKDIQDAKPLSERINEALAPVDFAPEDGKDGTQSLLGALGEVQLSGESGMLIVTTAVGIFCQYDDSAYGYKLADGSWQRVWESEQDDYAPGKYAPQSLIDVHVLRSFKAGIENGSFFILTLGNEGGCASFWHQVYYRVWRVDPSAPRLLIDGSESAWLRAEVYAVGSITQDRTGDSTPVDVLIEYTERSMDAGVHNREAVQHFLIDGDRVRRVDPVALSPRDFVDEWLTRPWKESASWSAAPALQPSHVKLHADFVGGEFESPAKHCQTPDLWQVGVYPQRPENNFEPGPEVYFLVRWRPPYHFEMADVRDRPWPRCRKEDPEADAWRTLFSTQEWRQ